MSETLLAEARMPEQRITELAEQMTASWRPSGEGLTYYETTIVSFCLVAELAVGDCYQVSKKCAGEIYLQRDYENGIMAEVIYRNIGAVLI
jgi:hypothetical protein